MESSSLTNRVTSLEVTVGQHEVRLNDLEGDVVSSVQRVDDRVSGLIKTLGAIAASSAGLAIAIIGLFWPH